MDNRGRDRKTCAIIAVVVFAAVCIAVVMAAGNAQAAAAARADHPAEAEQNAEEKADRNAELQRPAFTEDPESMERAAASVVMLTVFNDHDEKIGVGSGFAAFEPVVLVTAAHVIVNMEYMIAECDDGETFRIDSAIDADEDADVAICRLPEDCGLAALPTAGKDPLRGEKTAAVGSQSGLKNLITLGNICGRWDKKDVKWLLFTAPVSGGSSGGPLFNDAGEVIGVVTGTYERGQNLNLAAPVEKAAALLR